MAIERAAFQSFWRRASPPLAVLAAFFLYGAAPAQAGLFDVIDKVDKRIQNTEKKVDQTTRMKDSTKRINDKTGGLVDEAIPDRDPGTDAAGEAAGAANEAAGGPPPLPGKTGRAYYFESVGAGEQGLTLTQAAREISQGRVKRDTLAWSEGMAGWQPAGEIAELERHFGARPPPLPRRR